MTSAPETTATGVCIDIVIGSVTEMLLAVGAIAIPVVSVAVIARIARRNPSQALLSDGRRRRGVLLHRCGLVVCAAGIASTIAAVVIGPQSSTDCTRGGTVAVIGVLSTLAGILMVGGGWAYAIRGNWVVLATIAALDAWIFYTNLLIEIIDPGAVRGLLLLAFGIHGFCTIVAARWSFTAKDLGPVERAKAGEAGRTLAAVWAFLAAYTGLTLIRTEDGVFDTAAGSAVTGALTLGALAVTMGSGFTKYAEAVHAKPTRAADEQPATVIPASDSRDAEPVEVTEPPIPAPAEPPEPDAVSRRPATD